MCTKNIYNNNVVYLRIDISLLFSFIILFSMQFNFTFCYSSFFSSIYGLNSSLYLDLYPWMETNLIKGKSLNSNFFSGPFHYLSQVCTTIYGIIRIMTYNYNNIFFLFNPYFSPYTRCVWSNNDDEKNLYKSIKLLIRTVGLGHLESYRFGIKIFLTN